MNTQRIPGRIPVLESLRARKRQPHRLFVLDGATDLEPIIQAAGDITILTETRNRLDDLSGGVTHQGVVLEADPLPVLPADAWAKQDFPPHAVIVALDEIEDPHNFGAIIRSAAACGAHAVLFGKSRAAPITPAAVKAAAGGMEYIDLVRAANLVRALKLLKENGFWLAALEPGGSQRLWESDLSDRIVIVIGSEGKGIRPLVRKTCDFTATIPLQGPITSLNASVTAGIALAECIRRRR